MKMIKSANVGNIDRIVRIVVGLALILSPYLVTLGLWDNTIVRVLVQLVGLVLVSTALFRFCPLYRLIGVNTCKV